jgi:hypothetical protein
MTERKAKYKAGQPVEEVSLAEQESVDLQAKAAESQDLTPTLPSREGGEQAPDVSPMPGLIEGRIVHYVLTEEDARKVNELRHASGNQGERVFAGEHCPMIITRVGKMNSHYVDSESGQVFVDGNFQYWTNACFDEFQMPGTWHWIERS